MCDGGGNVEYGNGQPGNQVYDPGYGTAAQTQTSYPLNPGSTSVGAGAGGFNPDSTSGNIFTSSGVTSSANTGGTGSGGGGPLPSSTGNAGFDNLPGLNGIDLSYLNTPGVTSNESSVPGYGPTDLSALSNNGIPGTNVVTGTAGAGQSPVAGLPGVNENTDQNRTGGSGRSGGSGDKGIMDSLGIKNPLGTALAAGGLGYAVSRGQRAPKFSPEMESAARNLDANGRQLMSYLQSGNLPPGLKTSLDQATSAAKTKVISNFAAQGLSTDPTQNSVLAQQLAQIDQQAIISTAQIGQQLMSSGLAQSGLSSDLYKTLANIDQTQSAIIGRAIANFAAASSGSGGGLNLRLN